MTDAPRKKRPWFQLHLSTCVVLMFVAGTLIGLNVKPYWIKSVVVEGIPPREFHSEPGASTPIYGPDAKFNVVFDGPGWPAPAFYDKEFESLGESYEVLVSDYAIKRASFWGKERVTSILFNIVFGLVALAFFGLTCENLIRRRERARAGSVPGPDTAHPE